MEPQAATRTARMAIRAALLALFLGGPFAPVAFAKYGPELEMPPPPPRRQPAAVEPAAVEPAAVEPAAVEPAPAEPAAPPQPAPTPAPVRREPARAPARPARTVAFVAPPLPEANPVAESESAPAPLDFATQNRQEQEYGTWAAKSVLELQPFRRAASLAITGPRGRGTATLTDLNPAIREWYLLELRFDDGSQLALHLQNARPREQRVVLDPSFPAGVMIERDGGRQACALWRANLLSALEPDPELQPPYLPLCQGALYLRHRTHGSRTRDEWAADFLRENVPGGEALTNLIKRTLYRDSQREAATFSTTVTPNGPLNGIGRPLRARIASEHDSDRIAPRELGIATDTAPSHQTGRWYGVSGRPGIALSILVPDAIAPEVLGGYRDRVAELDGVERSSLVYLVAFDLDQFELGYELGTDHPRVDWSQRTRADQRDPSLPGPDGIGSIEPLQATGLVPPAVAERVVATFAAGFKRRHGAFQHGALAQRNAGSHYGFVVGGTVLSKLQPSLATLLMLDDGSVEMRTWTVADDANLQRVRHARQNGVPIIDYDSATGAAMPGPLVDSWGAGNWGGSQDSRLRSVRAGLCMQESNQGRFLIYAYFSAATPSAMARVFSAYSCSYAMQLDMNALEHTYLAVYEHAEDGLEVEHLVRGMNVLDKTLGDRPLPRFLGFADNRDFVYVMRRPESQQ